METQEFFEAFDLEIYRSSNSDLVHLSPEQMRHHYETFGQQEGRVCSAIKSRDDFILLANKFATAIELGPFFRPGLDPNTADFFDVLTSEELRLRAMELGQNPDLVPTIKWHDPTGSLAAVSDKYEMCYSSHSIEHQVDLVAHLNEVKKILIPGGYYFLVIPDHRYCFDALLPPSSIADVIEAHFEGHQKHTIRSVIEHRALVTHNDVVTHWLGDNGHFELSSSRVADAITEYQSSDRLDVHAWKFTPATFSSLAGVLRENGLISFNVERIYPTLRFTNEFFVILRSEDKAELNDEE